MKEYWGNDAQPSERNVLAAIGTFDGVHLGHERVLRTLTQWADELGRDDTPTDVPRASRPPAGVITFRTHPRKTLSGTSPDMLTTLEHRLVLFARLGLGFAWVLEFTPELARLTARDFARTYLVERLGARGLILGFDSSFGSDRVKKDSPELASLAQELGLATRTVDPVLAPEGETISSTSIRDAIFDGRLRDAAAMLGRHVSVYGTVIKGDARGRRLGYNTANLDLGQEVRPPFGVYATIARLGNQCLDSVTNVGYRPTIAQHLPPGVKPDLLIETHLFDFQGDLYGQKIEVLFIEKLRDERRFPDVAALVEQIRRDEARARAILRAHAHL